MSQRGPCRLRKLPFLGWESVTCLWGSVIRLTLTVMSTSVSWHRAVRRGPQMGSQRRGIAEWVNGAGRYTAGASVVKCLVAGGSIHSYALV